MMTLQVGTPRKNYDDAILDAGVQTHSFTRSVTSWKEGRICVLSSNLMMSCHTLAPKFRLLLPQQKLEAVGLGPQPDDWGLMLYT